VENKEKEFTTDLTDDLWFRPKAPPRKRVLGYVPFATNQLELNNGELTRNMQDLRTTMQEKENLMAESEQSLKTVQLSFNQMTEAICKVC
jgi:hypothetical protein